MKVYDFDSVEPHNLPNQGFGLPDLGQNKALVVAEKLRVNYGTEVKALVERVTEDTEMSTEVVIAAVDSMAARNAIWSSVKRSPKVELFIDGRMGAMYAEVFSVDMTNENSIGGYNDSLFDDSEGYQAPCTEKATIFCAAGTAAAMSSFVGDYAADTLKPKKVCIDWARKTMA